jgi:hypothetical protein
VIGLLLPAQLDAPQLFGFLEGSTTGTRAAGDRGVLASARASAIEEYLAWNEAIGSILLDGRFASRPAYLQLEPSILEEVAQAAGHGGDDDPRASLVAAVGATLGLDRVATPFLFHIGKAEQWEESGRDGFPPCLGLLSVLVLAAQDMVSDASHAAHNYYARLEQLLDLPQPLWARVHRHFSDTVYLWRGLNDWLEDWEGERGVPTAAVLDRRVYVGFPLSQALVRAADRARLHEAFLEYGLTPGRRIAAVEMRSYLGEWLTHQGASTRLGRMWDRGMEVRDRIVDIALGELAAWTGGGGLAGETRPMGTQRLRWAAELRDGPLPALDLYLTARADEASINGGYEVIAPSDKAAREAVAGCAEALRLDALPGCELASLEPWSSIGVPSLLAGTLRIRRRGHPATELAHSPDALIVLALDERDGWYREVSRAQLLEPCLIIAHADRAAAVEAHLRLHARPGFRRLEAQRLEGLPEGWVAFLDVTIVLAADEQKHPRIKSLCPAPANAVALSGGLRLGGSTWHVDAPPEVMVSLERGTRLRLDADCRRKLTDEAVSVELGDHGSPAAVPLAGESIEAGDYDLQVKDGRGQLLAHAGIRLRSADHPRPSRDLLNDVGHRLDDSRGLVTAAAAPQGAAFVSGAVIAGETRMPATPRLNLPARPLTAAAERAGRAPARAGRRDRSMYRHACVAGTHYWICDPGYMDETTRTLKRMRCRDCQREVWTVNRGRLAGARPAARISYARPLAPPDMAPPDHGLQGIKPPLDTLLDALTYTRSGSWESLKQMAGALGDDPMLAWAAARTLSALGHIDLILSPRDFRLAGWQIAPSTLLETGDGSWVLAGARSDRLVDRLDSLAGGSLSYEEEASGPTVLRLPPMSLDAACAMASALSAPLGGTVRLTPRFSAKVAASLPLLRSLLPELAVARMPSQGHELFDLQTGRWEPASDLAQAGAYRVELHGRLYGFADLDDTRRGEMRVTDVLTAKHLAAASCGVSLLGYDPGTRTLMTPVGAELPGVLHRVAALASGKPPQLHRQAGLTLYRDVDETIAAHLQRCLGIAA